MGARCDHRGLSRLQVGRERAVPFYQSRLNCEYLAPVHPVAGAILASQVHWQVHQRIQPGCKKPFPDAKGPGGARQSRRLTTSSALVFNPHPPRPQRRYVLVDGLLAQRVWP